MSYDMMHAHILEQEHLEAGLAQVPQTHDGQVSIFWLLVMMSEITSAIACWYADFFPGSVIYRVISYHMIVNHAVIHDMIIT